MVFNEIIGVKMKSKLYSLIILSILLSFINTNKTFAYGNKTSHKYINAAICRAFEKDFIQASKRLPKFDKYFINFVNSFVYFEGMYVWNGGNFSATEEIGTFTAYQWIVHGGYSADEPEVPASVRHFYDPLGNRNGKKYLTNRGTYWEGAYPNPGIDAIEWAFGDTPKGAGNTYTWVNGKQWMKQAFEELDKDKRGALFAKAYRALGEVLHNTADMGCPAHVRNDSHAAPLGLTWGFLLGSPDPYEEIMVTDLTENSELFDEKADQNLAEFFASAKTASSINEHLAKWTNANFFTDQTISGTANSIYYKSKNGEKDYPSPKLDNLEYDDIFFSFLKQFPSGRNVLMCKDYSYWTLNHRGKPYIDRACVMSQAAELIPAIVEAGKNVMRLYIPKFEVKLENVDNFSDSLKVIVKHITDEEYTQEIKFKGALSFFGRSTDGNLYSIYGDVKDSISIYDKDEYVNIFFNIKNGDKIKAYINEGAITIESEEIVVKMDPFWGKWEITQTFESTNEPITPETPKKGDQFKGDRYYKINPNNTATVSNLDGSGAATMSYSRSGSSHTMTAETSTLKLEQKGTMNEAQDTWTGTLKREYKSGNNWYIRNYTITAKRIPYKTK